MATALGDLLPLAVGIAISPVPVIAVILMLLSPRAKVTSIGFLAGWVAGIAVAVLVFVALSSILPDRDPDASHPIGGVVQLALGVLLLLAGVRQWRKRPAPGQPVELPKWMSAIDSFTFGRALALAFVLAAVNPKNLLLAISAGVSLAAAGLTGGATAAVLAVFTLLAASTVLIPVVAYLAASARLSGPLARLRDWLQANNGAIMAVLFLVLGVTLIGKGIGSF